MQRPTMNLAASVATVKRKEQELQTEKLHAKTFGAWVNNQLSKAGYPKVNDLNEDLKDGVNLIRLVEAMYKKPIQRKYTANPTTEIQRIENVAIALEALQAHNVKVEINSKDITDGNRKLTLGLMWRLIMGHQMLDSDDSNTSVVQKNKQAKGNLLAFCKKQTEGYNGVKIENFTDSFYDGMAFAALVHSINPNLIDWSSISPDKPRENLEKAFAAAEQLGIPRMLDVEDMLNSDPELRPDEKCVMTYVSEFPIAYIEHVGSKQQVVAPPAQTLPPAPDVIELERRRLEEEMKRKMEEEAARIAAEMKTENERLRAEAEQLKKQLSSNKDMIKQQNQEIDEDNKRLQEELERLKRENERLQQDLLSTKNKLIGKLNVTVKEARGLMAMDLNGKSDPYVRLKLEQQEYKTKIQKKTLTPKWDQDFEFYVTDKRAELDCAVWDWDRLSADDFMGKVTLKINELQDGQSETKWHVLQPLRPGEKTSGEILLSVTFKLGK